jgi:undecaprenyl-phosphate 4-deoxy-4-formamido-L-arabinose transferase
MTTSALEKPRLSIVVPLYRDVPNLEPLFDRLVGVIENLEYRTELVLVDDGSRDGTAERASELARDFPYPMTIVRLLRNFGQHPAVFAGLEKASGDIVVTMDSDLQYPPEDIPKLLANLSPEYPVVSGCRLERSDPWPRRFVTRFLSEWLSRRTGAKLRDYGSMFRAYDRRVVEQLLQFRESRRYVPGLVGWLGIPVKEVPIAHHARGEQGSRYRLGPLVDMFLDLITGYAAFPLRIITMVGFLGAMLALGLTLIFAAYRIVSGSGPAGLVSAFAVLFFLVGIQLVVLGVLGEYVGRIYIEAKGRPYYLVESVTHNDVPDRASR